MRGHDEAVVQVVARAPFDTFDQNIDFCLDKVVRITFHDTYKMIPMPLADFG